MKNAQYREGSQGRTGAGCPEIAKSQRSPAGLASGRYVSSTAEASRVPKKSRPCKRFLHRFNRWAAGRLGVVLSRLLGSCGREAFGILMYHRVGLWDQKRPGPTWNVKPQRFR